MKKTILGLEDKDDLIAWLKNNTSPWCTVAEYWKETIKHRQQLLSKATIKTYFELFPCLNNDNGYELVWYMYIWYLQI